MVFSIPQDKPAIEQALRQHILGATESKITTVALVAVALVSFGVACLLWGIGTSPGTMLSGTEFIPYVSGIFFGSLSIGVVAGAALFALRWALHANQITSLKEALERS